VPVGLSLEKSPLLNRLHRLTEDLTNTFTSAGSEAGMCSQKQNEERERGEKGAGGDPRSSAATRCCIEPSCLVELRHFLLLA